MKFKLLFISFFLVLISFGQNDVKKNIYYGNTAFYGENYEEAMTYYEKAISESPFNYKANYNMATTYFKLEIFDKASEKYETLINQTNNPFKKAMLYHNIGNCNLANQKLDNAIESYKSSLRLNPSSEETRYNLAYALELKKQQQQKQQEEKQDKQDNKGEQSDENKNGGQNNDGSDGNQDNQNNDENSENKEAQSEPKDDSDQGEQKNNESQSDNESQQKEEPNKMSEGRKNALKVLEEANKKEKAVQEMMIKNQNGKNSKSKNNTTTKKDW